MNQPAKLQQVINYLCDSDAKMKQGDHIGFGMFCIFVFIFSMAYLTEDHVLAFVVLSGCLGLAIPVYYWASTLRRRKSWYWGKIRREIEGKSFREMWDTSERGDWLLWFCAHMIGKSGWPTHQQVVLAACQCARLGIEHIKSDDMRPLKAIETVEAWARGKATVEEVRQAATFTEGYGLDNTACYASRAAKDAAWTVYAKEDGCCFRLAQASAGAATFVGWASASAVSATPPQAADSTGTGHISRDEAERVTLRKCADIVRRMLKVPNDLTNELPIHRWVKGWERNLSGGRTGRNTYIPISLSRISPDYELRGDEIDNSRDRLALRIATSLVVLAAARALFGALGENPIEYYTDLRWWTCLAAVMLVWRGDVQGSLKWAYLLAPVAVLFNPVVPIHLHGRRSDVLSTWKTADIAAAVILVLSLALMETQVWAAKKRRQQMACSKSQAQRQLTSVTPGAGADGG